MAGVVAEGACFLLAEAPASADGFHAIWAPSRACRGTPRCPKRLLPPSSCALVVIRVGRPAEALEGVRRATYKAQG
jgi:hypothetical protein